MDPWYDILNGENQTDRDSNDQNAPLLDIARFLQQMGVLENFDYTGLAPPASKTAVESLAKEEVKEDTGIEIYLVVFFLCIQTRSGRLPMGTAGLSKKV